MMAGNSNSNSCRDVAVLMLEEQLLELALNLTVHCCGREFRVLNGYDQKSFDARNEALTEANVFPVGTHLRQTVLRNSTRWLPPKTRSRSCCVSHASGRLVDEKYDLLGI
ncbi:hypothetical protein Tco_0617659 [Tanacetum coccineum]